MITRRVPETHHEMRGAIEILVDIRETIRTTHQSSSIRDIIDIMSPSTDNTMIGGSTGATHRTDTRDSTETDIENKHRWMENNTLLGIINTGSGRIALIGITVKSSIINHFFVCPFIRLIVGVASLSNYPLYLNYLAW